MKRSKSFLRRWSEYRGNKRANRALETVVKATAEALEQRLMFAGILSSDIRVTGERDFYSFDFPTPKLLYFDALTNESRLRWSLDGPNGNVVSNRLFTQSDSVDIGNPVISVPAGTYSFTIDGVGDFTGSYQFQILDLNTDSTAITPGTPVTDALVPGNSTKAYTFTANAGDSFTFDSAFSTLSDARWRLIDRFNNVVFQNLLNTDVTNVKLTAGGTYHLLAEGRISNTAASGSYSFNVNFLGNTPPVPFTGTPLTIGNTVTSNISVGGEVDPYTFTLANPARLNFDALGDFANMQWTLLGPAGTVVSNRGFQNSDSFDFGNPVLDLPAGGYQLSVSGTSAGVTGAYSFRLQDFAAATPLTPGTPVSSTLNPATETDLYQFNVATANSKFYFDVTTGIGNASWRLIDPLGNVLFNNGFTTDNDTTNLAIPGTYWIAIEGRRNAGAGSVAYAFNVVPNLPSSTALTLNSTVNGTISVPGESDDYTFNLVVPTRVAFDVLGDFANMHWNLVGPGGLSVVNGRPLQGSDSFDFATPYLDLPGGAYTLTIDGDNDAVGAYSFRLLNYASATTITPGTPVSDSLSPATETDIYKINVATAGGKFFFDETGAPGNATWRLIDPFGAILFSTSFNNDQDTMTLPQPGTYYLVIEGRRNAGVSPAAYAFNVVPDVPSSTPLSLGTTINGTLSVPGESDGYTFTLAAGAKLNFDVLGDFPNMTWNLVGPGGTTFVSSRQLQNSDSFDISAPYVDVPAGSYTLTIDGDGDKTGAYSFRVQDYSAAALITPGTPVSSTLNPATETDLYKFNVAVAGSKFYFDVITGVSNASWRLIDPSGNVLFTNGFSTDNNTLALSQTGTYFVVVEGRRNAGNGSAPYVFNVVPDVASSTPLTLGTTVNASIGVPGESDDYTFTLASAARVGFDTLTDNGNLQWSLTGPGGFLLVNNRNFQNSDSFDISVPFIDLAAGSYTLTVDGTNDTTGAYSFRLLNYANATAINPGTPVSSTLNPANETDIYKFDVPFANNKFYFDVTTGINNASWRLIDPFGNVLFSNNFNTDNDTMTLAQTGTYFVVVEGRRNAGSGSVPYTFNVQPVNNSTSVLTFGSTVNSTISTPGESDDYLFTLGATFRVAMDVMTDNNGFQWSLHGPGGVALVSNENFQGTDSFDGNPVMTLGPGNYTLTIDGVSDATGAYGFRMLDLASATAVTAGTPVNGTLNPGNGTDLYKFTVANAGDTFLFDSTSPGVNASWRLYDPLGNELFSGTPSLQNDQGPLTLNPPGVYTLVLEGRRNASTSQAYQFNIVPQGNTPPTPFTGTALTLGNIVSDTISAAGEQDSYQFTLLAPETLYFDSLTNNTNLRWSLKGAAGTLINLRAFNSSDSLDIADPQIALPAGSYQLTVSMANSATGAYSFRLFDPLTGVTIIPGTPVVGTLTLPNETDSFKFNGTAGGKVFFDVQARTGAPNAHWRLIDPSGNIVFNNLNFGDVNTDVDTLTLPLTGPYVLLIEGRFNDAGGATANYTFNVQPVTDSTTPLTLGNVVSSNISVTGEQDNYTFTLGAASTLYFDSLTNDTRLRWSLTGPGGTVVNNRLFNSSDSIDITDPQLHLPAGNYTLTIDGIGDEVTPYSFRLSDLATATPLTPGTPVTGTLNPANETDAYKFTATAGSKFYFDVQERTGASNARWRLIDPNGNFIFNNLFFGDVNEDVDTQTLPLTGTYTLLLEGRFNDAGTPAATYTFNVQPVSNVSTPLVIGTTINSNIAVTGEQDAYTFTLASAATLYFDDLTLNDPTLRWSLTGPSGTIVSNRGFNSSDSVDISDPQLRLPAGSYTLTVDATVDNKPSYSFRLLDLSVGTAITTGTPFSGTLNPADETDVFKFSANAGDKFYFNVQERTGAPNARWRLIDPNGNFVFNNAGFGDVNTDIDTLAVPLTGTYTLLIEGRFLDTGTATYTVDIQPVIDTTTPLVLGAVTDGKIDSPGQMNNFTFTLPNAATLYFDNLTASNSNLRWSLTGPSGNVVTNRTLNGSDSVDIADPQLRLPAGDYTLTFDGTGETTAPYEFRLFDLATATPITKGAPFSNTLNPANETDAYKFSAAAGDQIFFDVRARTNAPNARWRLIDPQGNFVFNNAGFGDVNTDIDTLTMPLTGTYTLLIEGRFNDAGGPIGTYTINIQPVIDGILPVVAGGFFDADTGPNHRVQFAFSQNVGASVDIGDFSLMDLTTNTAVPLSTVTYDNQNNIATVSVGHTLAQGNYRMTLIANGINDAFGHKLDGNADGVEGDDYQFDFFFYPGDANQDRTVNFADLIAVAQNYGKTGKLFSQGDFNYDGVVNFADLVTVAQHYGQTLPPAPPPGPAAPVASAPESAPAGSAAKPAPAADQSAPVISTVAKPAAISTAKSTTIAPDKPATSTIAALPSVAQAAILTSITSSAATLAVPLPPPTPVAPARKPFSVSRISRELFDVEQPVATRPSKTLKSSR